MLTDEQKKILNYINSETKIKNQRYQKVQKDLGLRKMGHAKAYGRHTCYRYKYLFKVYLTEMDICHRDYWQFEFAKTMYNKKLRLCNRLYAQFKNQKIEVIDQEGNIYTTTPDQIIHHRDVHALEFVEVFQKEVS
jgi:hypothetical protein